MPWQRPSGTPALAARLHPDWLLPKLFWLLNILMVSKDVDILITVLQVVKLINT